MATAAEPLRIGATIDLADFYKTMAAVARHCSDLSPVFEKIDANLTDLLKQQFASQGRTFGTPWAPASPATLAVRHADGIGGTQALVATGGLRASFTTPGAPGSIRIIDALRYVRGSDYKSSTGVPLATMLQTGFISRTMPVFGKSGRALFIRRPDGPKRIPGRPILPATMPAPVVRTWEGYVAQFLLDGE
jgi:hypothetical protein